MEWQEICDYPRFRDLPFKVETNQGGQLEMTPASNERGLFQALIVQWLADSRNGKVRQGLGYPATTRNNT